MSGEPQYAWLAGDPVPGAPGLVRKPDWDYHVEWFNIKRLIAFEYGREWSWEHDGQNTYITVCVDGDPEGTEFDGAENLIRQIIAWQNCTSPGAWDGPHPDTMLWDLCRRGVIPAGRYLITVWW